MKTDENGVTRKAHFEQVQKSTGRPVPELDGPEFPEEGRHWWSMFMELSRARSSNGFGPNPISYIEIDAWRRLTDVDLSPFDVKMIRMLDDLWITTITEKE